MISPSLLKMISDFEGRVPHMYLDTRDNITVGVGHVIADVALAVELPFVLRRSRVPALSVSITSDFSIIEVQPAGKSAAYYAACTVCDLPDAAIDDRLSADVSLVQLGLSNEFTSWDTFPESVQSALTDMGFNLGVHGLITKFPRLCMAVRQENWRTCAEESRREGVSDLRNDTVRSLFLSATPTGDVGINVAS